MLIKRGWGQVSLYAYLPYEEAAKVQHDTGVLFHYEGKEVWLFQSTNINSDEREMLKKQGLGRFKCFSCGEDMKFVAHNKKNNYFSHFQRKECTLPESLEHAITKLKIYTLFKQAGYIPRLERVFNTIHADYNPRADVFVEAISGSEKIVVEVQGNKSILPNTVAKRTMAYAAEKIPTAWVLILENYFEQYGGTTVTEVIKHNDGSFTNEVRALRYDEDSIFTVSGAPKSFSQLMAAYGYVIAVNHEGHFFLIRQDVFSNSDVYRISRIPHENLVEVLLTTELVDLDYHYEPKTMKEKGFFHGLAGFDHELTEELMKNNSPTAIDFELAYQIELERLKSEGKLDPLFLIRQLKEVREFVSRDKIREKYSAQREKMNESKYRSGVERFNRNYTKLLNVKTYMNDLMVKLIQQKEEQEELLYMKVYENTINEWNSRLDEKQIENMQLKIRLKKILSELEQKALNIEKYIETRTQEGIQKRQMILAEIDSLQDTGGKSTQRGIIEVVKVYGEFNKQTNKELVKSLKQIKNVYSQEIEKQKKKEEKKSIEQLRDEERRYRETREWRLF